MQNRTLIASFIVVAGLLIPMQTLRSQITLNIDATVQRGIGGVSTLDRSRFFNHHGTLAPPSNTNLGDLASDLVNQNGLNSTTGRTSTEFDQFIS